MTKKEDAIKELTRLKGIGREKAELMFEKGIDSIEKLKKTSVKKLSTIEGIGEKTAEKILQQLKTPAKTVKKEKTTMETKTRVAKETKEKKETTEEKKIKTEEETRGKTKVEKETEEKLEIIEEKEEEGYKVKKKPVLNEEIKTKLLKRKQLKKRKPKFLRQESFRYKRIPLNWRRPRGHHSKMRLNLKYRPKKVRIGYGGPKETKGFHPSGFQEVHVYNERDLEKINPETQAARIGGTVGSRKRAQIIEKAKELDIRVLNQ